MTDHTPALSIIIPWRDRPEIATTLRHNHPLVAAHDAEVVVVNCGGRVEPLRALLADQAPAVARWLEIPAARFNKSLALNLGVWAARAERLFFLDADIFLHDESLPAALRLLDGSCFVTIDRVVESQPRPVAAPPCLRELAYAIELVGRRRRAVRIETNRIRLADGSRAGPGLILLTRAHFLQVDGMNAALEGWGWEDLDLVARLQLALGLRRRHAGTVTHLTHDDALRAGADARAASEQANFATCLANYGLGHYAGSYHQDVVTWRERLALHGPAGQSDD